MGRARRWRWRSLPEAQPLRQETTQHTQPKFLSSIRRRFKSAQLLLWRIAVSRAKLLVPKNPAAINSRIQQHQIGNSADLVLLNGDWRTGKEGERSV